MHSSILRAEQRPTAVISWWRWTVLILGAVHAAAQAQAPANPGPLHPPTSTNLAAALTSALFPAHPRIPDSPTPKPLPQADALLDALLADPNLNLSAAHWQSQGSDLATVLALLRRGREAVATISPLAHDLRHAPGGTSPVRAAFTAWLAAVRDVLGALPEGPSYPFLRRAVVALLLRWWLAAGGDLGQSEDAAATDVLLKLYSQHRVAASRKAALEFYHVSKAAGTSVCLTSAALGCRTFSFTEQYTCLVPQFGDGPRWINRHAHMERCRRTLPQDRNCTKKIYSKLARWGNRYSSKGDLLSCSGRRDLLGRNGYNFFASEYTLRGRAGNVSAPPALCHDFLNLMVLRSPRARLHSHLRYIVRVTYDMMGNDTALYFSRMSLTDWRRLLPAVSDNYYVRTLLGEDGFYTPAGGLNASFHLPSARAALAAMDVIFVLEDPEPLLQLGHSWGLGWTRTFLQVAGRSHVRARREAEEIADQVLPSGLEAEQLEAANSLDEQVYEFAVLLSRLDAVVWAAAELAARRAEEQQAPSAADPGGPGAPGAPPAAGGGPQAPGVGTEAAMDSARTSAASLYTRLRRRLKTGKGGGGGGGSGPPHACGLVPPAYQPPPPPQGPPTPPTPPPPSAPPPASPVAAPTGSAP